MNIKNKLITCSIVLYKSDVAVLEKAIKSFLSTNLNVKLYLIDNSPSDELKNIVSENDNVVYFFMNKNLGFGSGHNVAIRKAQSEGSLYHLILNPDVEYLAGTLEAIESYMSENETVGLLMPKVLNADGSTQYVAKMLPTPLDFIVRRLPLGSLKKIYNDTFTLKKSGYNQIMDVPYLSGCFLFVRTEIFDKVGMFDEGLFLHFEDLDFTRRVFTKSKAIFYPFASIVHDTEYKSFGDTNMFKIYMRSFFYYFNKWGWFFDADRKRINQEILSKLQK